MLGIMVAAAGCFLGMAPTKPGKEIAGFIFAAIVVIIGVVLICLGI